MKKTLLSLALCFGAFVTSGTATILVQDSFPTDGNLVGTTPSVGGIWTVISGATPTLSVTGGLVTIASSNGQDATSQFASPTAGDLFAGFDFTLTTAPGISDTGAYIASFRDGTAASGSYAGRFFVRRSTGTSATEFQVGVASNAGDLATAGAAIWATNLTLGSTYRIVMRFDSSGGDDTTLWVNPIAIDSTNITSTDDVSVINLDGFALRQASGNHGGSTIGNLSVGTTFGEVASVPEPGTVALVAVGLGVVILGVRRRRA